MASTTDLPPARTRRIRWRRWLAGLTLGYIGFLIVLLALENRFVYHPLPATQAWVPAPDAAIQDVEFESQTGDRIHGWWWPRPGATTAMLYCHGNAGNLSHRAGTLIRFADALDSSALIFDYPGYGHSTGVPTERSCVAAGEAAWHWLATEQKFPAERITLVGASLGGAVATDLAREHGCRALVLVKAFTSIPDMATSRFPWLPARYFVRHRYDNLEKLPHVHRPVFITHGTADRVIPFSHGERLFAAANEPKEFVPLPGNDHNDGLPDELFTRLRRFVTEHNAK
jgi:pimeloyl-ACP methyl ester carboxylesterase